VQREWIHRERERAYTYYLLFIIIMSINDICRAAGSEPTRARVRLRYHYEQISQMSESAPMHKDEWLL
jgi:hypothetical protein